MAGVEQSLNMLAQQLRDELRGMWRFRWKALAVAWGVLLVGSIAVATLPDSYLASSRVYVDSASRLGKLLQGLAVETNVEAQVAVVRQTLLSRPHLEALTRAPEYASKAALERRTPAQQERMVESLRKKIEILPVRGAETGGALILGVSIQDESRDRALFVVRSLIEGFVSETADATRNKAEVAQSFLLKELKELTGLGRSTLYAKGKPGSSQFDQNFPQRVRLGPENSRSVGWPRAEVLAWLDLTATTRRVG